MYIIDSLAKLVMEGLYIVGTIFVAIFLLFIAYLFLYTILSGLYHLFTLPNDDTTEVMSDKETNNLSTYKNVKVLGKTDPILSKEEHDMFWLGRVVAIHSIGEHEIIEYLGMVIDDGVNLTHFVSDKHQFHSNTAYTGYCDTLDSAILLSLCGKYLKNGMDASSACGFISKMINMPITGEEVK